jgi:hypothetical protein
VTQMKRWNQTGDGRCLHSEISLSLWNENRFLLQAKVTSSYILTSMYEISVPAEDEPQNVNQN